jgi:hypothetical protein
MARNPVVPSLRRRAMTVPALPAGMPREYCRSWKYSEMTENERNERLWDIGKETARSGKMQRYQRKQL